MSRGGENNDTFRLEYRFTMDGRTYGGAAPVKERHWKSLGVGLPIAIRYLPSAPDRNYPSTDPPRRIVPWGVCLLFGFVAVLGVRMYLKVRRERRLLEDGRPAPALVTRLKKWWTEDGLKYIVHYRFSLPDGATYKGRSNFHAKPIPEGSVICILYDPDNPLCSDPYRLRTVKLAAN
jgi:hypothetical protein